MSEPRPAFQPPPDIAKIIADRRAGISRRQSLADQIAGDLAAIEARRFSDPDFYKKPDAQQNVARIANLSFCYAARGWRMPWRQRELMPPALQNVSMDWDGPGIIMLGGRSGCGKSTLLRLVGGAQNFAVPQIGGSARFCDTPHENILTASRGIRRRFYAAASLLLMGSDDWGNSEHERRMTLNNTLSSGFSRLMLLDEPLRLLPRPEAVQYEDRMRRLAIDGQRTIVIVTHDWRFIRVADRVILMEEGRKIIDDDASTVLKRGDLPNYIRRTLDNPRP